MYWVSQPMKASITMTTAVRGTEYQIIRKKTEIIATAMVSRLGSAWLMSWRRASTSLV